MEDKKFATMTGFMKSDLRPRDKSTAEDQVMKIDQERRSEETRVYFGTPGSQAQTYESYRGNTYNGPREQRFRTSEGGRDTFGIT
jgi:hypothetical protein